MRHLASSITIFHLSNWLFYSICLLSPWPRETSRANNLIKCATHLFMTWHMFSWPKRKKARTKKQVTIHSYYSVQITQSKCNMFPRCHFAAAFVDLVTNSFSIYLVFTEKFIDSHGSIAQRVALSLCFLFAITMQGERENSSNCIDWDCHAVPEMKGCCSTVLSFFPSWKKGENRSLFSWMPINCSSLNNLEWQQ